MHLEGHGIDCHGRTLATIYVQCANGENWINVNERMVTLGHAWVMRGKIYDHLPKDRQGKLNYIEEPGPGQRRLVYGAPKTPYRRGNGETAVEVEFNRGLVIAVRADLDGTPSTTRGPAPRWPSRRRSMALVYPHPLLLKRTISPPTVPVFVQVAKSVHSRTRWPSGVLP